MTHAILESWMAAMCLVGGLNPQKSVDLIEACAKSPDPYVCLSIAHTESRWGDNVTSSAGACCYMQILGGKWGNPPCGKLRRSADLCVKVAFSHLKAWHARGCTNPLEAYHKGKKGCHQIGGWYFDAIVSMAERLAFVRNTYNPVAGKRCLQTARKSAGNDAEKKKKKKKVKKKKGKHKGSGRRLSPRHE